MLRRSPRRIAVLWLLTGVVACRGPAPASEAPPPRPPVSFGQPRLDQTVSHQLVFTPGRAYEGLELQVALLDKNGFELELRALRVGPIFAPETEENPPPLRPGQQLVHRIVPPPELVKVRGPRPRSPLDRRPVALERIHAARLRAAFRCHQEEYEWQPGIDLPPGVNEVPPPGTVFSRIVCQRERALQDRTLATSFAYHRLADPNRAWIDVVAHFGPSFPRGLTVQLLLLDRAGQPVDPRCTLELRQPPIFDEDQRAELRLEFLGPAAVRRAQRVATVRAGKLVPDGGDVRQATVRQVCR
jgi:hypothetical protein